MTWNDDNLIRILKNGGVAVMPTDTIYGIVGKAENISTVNRIYDIKKRRPEKPCIILISDISQLAEFSIILSPEQKNKLQEYWPGQVSIVLDCADDLLEYLHRDTKTLAFRLPVQQTMRDLILKVGPLIAPSANPEGSSPAQNIDQAKKYFGGSVDLYMDGGSLIGKASKIIKLNKNGVVIIIRE